MPEELPSGDKAVYVFLEMIALGFVLFAIEEAFRDNPSWSKVGVAAVLGFICFVTGIKWPQIKAKIWKPIAAGLERTASNRWVVGAVVVVLLTGVAYRYFHRNLDASQTIRQST